MPGVTIGKGSIIGANSLVTKSIPEYSIAVGSPAKVIKKVRD
jgi:acetyltransferase-like isoleucine patch superfamily enzyme